MSGRCPAGHASDEVDYCSVCGVAMPAPAVVRARDPLSVGPGAGAAGPACPACGEPRADVDARFCEVCRFDFVKRAPGPAPTAARATPLPSLAAPSVTPLPSPVASRVTPLPSPVVDPALQRWELVLTIDPLLDDEPDPAVPPPNDPERIFPVEIAEMLVGRRDDRQNIRPAVPLNDPGASRRHAKFLRNPDGTVSLQDLASMNGTKLNGADVVSGSLRPLVAGDEVTLGRWSRIKLRARS